MRRDNEEGMFDLLNEYLEQKSEEYNVPMDKVQKLFISVSCSKRKLEEMLKGIGFSKWTALEDLALKKGDASDEYAYLVQSKSDDEIRRRKKFLGIIADGVE